MLPTKLRSRPIEVGRSPGRSRRNAPSSSRRTRGVGQVRDEPLPDPDRAGARTAAAVGRAERLVDVEVHDVEAGLAGLEPAEDGVEVRAVHVGEGAGLVDRVEQLADPPLEQAERRRVGDHDRGRPRPERRSERVDVDAAVGGRRDGDRPEAGHRGRRRVRAVRRVRDEDLVALGVAAARGGTPGS